MKLKQVNMNEIMIATLNDLDPLANLFDLYRQFYRQASDPEGARRFLAARISNSESVIFLAKQGSEFKSRRSKSRHSIEELFTTSPLVNKGS